MTAGAHRLNILVIDDDPDVLAYAARALSDHGYAVITSSSGAAGLQLVRRNPPDLICLDISMPPPTGVTIYRELKGDPLLQHIPVVIVTGVDPRFQSFISSRRHIPPPEGFISKPFCATELCSVVDDVLGPRPLLN